MTETAAGATPPDATPEPVAERMSEALRRLAGSEAGDDAGARVSVGDLFHKIGDRAHYALLILFALPNTLPGIPGTSAVLGVPLLYLTLQLALGREPWLPGFITNRSVGRETLAAITDRALPWIEKGERYLHPRLTALTGARSEQAIGALSVVLAAIIMLPIPFGNMMPALAIIFFALGLMEQDGVWIVGALVTAILSLAIVVFVLWAVIKSAVFVIIGAFGLG